MQSRTACYHTTIPARYDRGMKRYTLPIEDVIAEAAEIVLAANDWRSRVGRRRATALLVEFFQRANVPAEASLDGLKVAYKAPSRGAADDLHFAAVCHLAQVNAERTALHWVRHAERRHSK